MSRTVVGVGIAGSASGTRFSAVNKPGTWDWVVNVITHRLPVELLASVEKEFESLITALRVMAAVS